MIFESIGAIFKKEKAPKNPGIQGYLEIKNTITTTNNSLPPKIHRKIFIWENFLMFIDFVRLCLLLYPLIDLALRETDLKKCSVMITDIFVYLFVTDFITDIAGFEMFIYGLEKVFTAVLFGLTLYGFKIVISGEFIFIYFLKSLHIL